MTSVYDIPLDDIRKFLLANNKNFDLETDGYQTALSLLKDKNVKGHTTSIIEWMIAHNLIINNVDIPHYSTYEIDNMNQNDINKLAKLLTMKGNNRNNIKNILKYLNKLDEKEFLLPEINDLILGILDRIELENIDNLKPDEIINLLKTHRNKAFIRKMVYDNLTKIIFYNFLGIDILSLSYLTYIITLRKNLSTDVIYQLIIFNENKLHKYHTIDQINRIKRSMEISRPTDIDQINIGEVNMDKLIKFIIDLIDIDEIGLFKESIYLVNKYKLIVDRDFNYYLIQELLYKINDITTLKNLNEFFGEEVFDIYIEDFMTHDFIEQSNSDIFLKNLVKLQKYDLLIKFLERLNYGYFFNVIPIILKKTKKAIESKNDDLIMRYLDVLKIAYGYRIINSNKLNRLIEEAEKY